MTEVEFKAFCERHMSKSGRLVAARLQAALALLERVRDHQIFDLWDHKPRGSSGLESHETFGDRAHDRYKIDAINKNHGRRSSNLDEWGQPLLDHIRLASAGLSTVSACDRVQQMFADKLREILELEPLRARMNARTAESVIADILQQADERGKVGVVAQYLVGAKLQLRFPGQDIQREAYNKGDRKKRGDPHARLADFEVAEAVIEVALGTPDEKHLDQVMDILETSSSEVWLLVRAARLGAWQSELAALNAPMRQRVVVVGVESFVGQNVTELGGFSSKGKHDQLLALFKLYNEQWIERLGPASLRIDAGPPVQASEGGVPRSRV